MAKYIDQTITFTFDELKVLRKALVAYENETDLTYDVIYDKVERGIHDSLGERTRVVRQACNDCDFRATAMCPVFESNGAVPDCQLREDMVEVIREEERFEND